MPARKKPTAIKKLQGTLQKCRTNPNEIQPTIAVQSSTPEELNEWGAQMWEDVFKELSKFGVVTKVDLGSLLAVCTEWGRYCEANDLIAVQGLMVKEDVFDKKGQVVGERSIVNPMINVANNAFKNYRAMCMEFGMTPASRTNVGSNTPVKEDSFSEFD